MKPACHNRITSLEPLLRWVFGACPTVRPIGECTIYSVVALMLVALRVSMQE